MNQRQRMILIVSAALIAMMLIYPPFQIMGRGRGYNWIFSPPHHAAIINVGQLLVQWVAVVLIGGIMFLLSKDGKTSVGSVGTEKTSETAIPEGAFTTTLLALRLVRGFAGFIGGWQLVGLLPVFSWVANYNPDADFGGMAVITLMKLLVALICFGVFFGLRSVINKLYFKRHGVQHPALIKKWGL